MITSENIDSFFKQREIYGIKPGLDRVKKLLASFKNPEKNLPAIHVTGTNGKGSVIHYLNRSLRVNDYKVGVFSSPHTNIYDHIKVNDDPISEQLFCHYLNQLMPYIKKLDEENNHPSKFEIITVIAFLYFCDRNVQFALIETGMGARLDTTNVIQPLISIITSISIDHTQFLGSTIEQVTKEKAGIIKKRVPLIVGMIEETSKYIIKMIAQKKEAPTYFLNEQFKIEPITEKQFKFINDQQQFSIQAKMYSHHQQENIALTLKALKLLKKNHPIHFKSSLKAIETTVIPGRFEMLMKTPKLIIDGAHNEASIKALIKTVKSYLPDERIELIYASFIDKELNTVASLLEGYFPNITLTTFNHKRAASVKQLSNYFNKKVKQEVNWKELLDQLLKEKEDKTILITGSLHFILLIRQYVLKIDE